MPPRSKGITMLPPYLRDEIERRLFGNGFRDYEGLAHKEERTRVSIFNCQPEISRRKLSR
jgi:hypothetical protein